MKRTHDISGFPGFLFIVMVLTISACGSSPKTEFYLLEQLPDNPLTRLDNGVAIAINPVKIAPYLDRPQIVTRVGPNKLNLSEFNHWSEPLSESISRFIAMNLSNHLKTNRVYLLPGYPSSIPLDYKIHINISRFDGQLGKNTHLTARWSVVDGNNKIITTKISKISIAINGKEYEDLIMAENRTLQKFSAEISATIKSIDSLNEQ